MCVCVCARTSKYCPKYLGEYERELRITRLPEPDNGKPFHFVRVCMWSGVDDCLLEERCIGMRTHTQSKRDRVERQI